MDILTVQCPREEEKEERISNFEVIDVQGRALNKPFVRE